MMNTSWTSSSRMRASLPLAVAVFFCGQWLFLAHDEGLSLVLRTLLPGLAIFGAALLLSWGSEIAQFDIPQALAFVFVAVIAVLPEYAVDIYFAWMAGKDPSYTPYAIANMTGANRILIGVGWAGVLLAYALKSRRKFIPLESSHYVEMLGLLVATVYSFVLPFKGTLTLIDSVIFFLIFAGYVKISIGAHVIEPELEGGPVELVSLLSPGLRRFVVLLFFAVAGWTIIAAAEPFAEGLLGVGRKFQIDQFIMVQWIAPIASEAPEFLIAAIFALRLKPTAGFTTLISSKINQWTLLIGALPIAYCLASGTIRPMVFDARQVEEIFLTAAQSFFALVLIMNLRFEWWNAMLVFILFAVQIFFPSTLVRYVIGIVYIVLSAGIFMLSRDTRRAIPKMMALLWRRP